MDIISYQTLNLFLYNNSQLRYNYVKQFLKNEYFINSGGYNSVYKIYFIDNDEKKIVYALRESKNVKQNDKKEHEDRFNEYKFSRKMEEIGVGVKIHCWFWIDIHFERKIYTIMDYYQYDFLEYIYVMKTPDTEEFLWKNINLLLDITLENEFFLLDCKPSNVLIHEDNMKFIDFDTEWVIPLFTTKFNNEMTKKCNRYLQLYFFYLYLTLTLPHTQIFVNNLNDLVYEIDPRALREVLHQLIKENIYFYKCYFKEYKFYDKLLSENKLSDYEEMFECIITNIVFSMYFCTGSIQRRP